MKKFNTENRFLLTLKDEDIKRIKTNISDSTSVNKGIRIKIEATQIDKVIVQNELNVKVKTYYNDLVALKENLRLYNETFLAYETLLKGENTRFENGESSLFLINSRQNKVLETRLKMNELESKLMKYQMSVYLLAGQQPKN